MADIHNSARAEERHREAARTAAQARAPVVVTTYCLDCGEKIPEDRRAAVRTWRCRECAEEAEKRRAWR